MLRLRRHAPTVACATFLVASVAPLPMRALILGGATAAQTSAPADDPGWDNVVSVNGSSGVYLGAGWVLTAAHVGAGGVAIAGTTHAVQPGAVVRLRAGDGTGPTDALLFRLATSPALPAVALAESELAANTAVALVGFGKRRGAAVSYDANWNLGGAPVVHAGYAWAGNVKGWGTNRIAGTATTDYGYGAVFGYVTDFSSGAAATAYEAQGALNDSGGAVFAKVGGAWRLAGLMVTIATHEGQPGDVAIFGDLTLSLELAALRPQIEALRGLAAPFAIWEFDHFRGAPIDALADPDGDGVVNLQEFAFGGNPLVADAPSVAPQVALADYADGAALTATFTRDTAATDVACVVEVSDDLVTWTNGAGATATVSTTNLGENREQLVVRDLVPTTAAGRRFLRVRVKR